MSDVMLLGVLRMPMGEIHDPMLRQFVDRARQAADRIEADAAEIVRLRAALADVVDTDWAFLGADADTGNPASLYSRVRRGRMALVPVRPDEGVMT